MSGLKEIVIPGVPVRTGSEFDRAVKERFETLIPVKLPVYSYQELSALAPQPYAGAIVRCSNGNAGAECLAYCNGRAWFVIELGDRISI